MSNHARRILGVWLFAGSACLLAVPALANPMTYTGTVVTTIKVNGKTYAEALVTVKFSGDTANIATVVTPQGTAVPSFYCTSSNPFFWLTTGKAWLSVESHGQVLSTRFLPNQIFVALDSCNGGIGFGSHTGPNGLEPAYPLAFTLGTAMSTAVGTGLSAPASMSGNAWSCVGYPPGPIGNLLGTSNQECLSPDPYPLMTEAGPVVFYLPYRIVPLAGDNHIGTQNRGTFSITPGASE